MQKNYKGFTPEQRMANLKRVKEAIKLGLLNDPMQMKCEICGQDKGIREYHCYDYNYDVALDSLMCLCFRCHRYLHIYEIGASHKWYRYAIYYFNQVRKGKIFDPVMSYKKGDKNGNKRNANQQCSMDFSK